MSITDKHRKTEDGSWLIPGSTNDSVVFLNESDQQEYIERFIGDIELQGCAIQAGSVKRIGRLLTRQNCMTYIQQSKEDRYFLGGVNPGCGTKRASDKDILQKNYLYLDFDVRKEAEANGEEISDEQIKGVAHELITKLTADTFLSRWRYIVFSGNGLHVYYIGESVEVKQPEAWKIGMQSLLRDAAAICDRIPDPGCINIARLARLPGTLNMKRGQGVRTEVIAYQDEHCDISDVIKRGKTELQRIEDGVTERAALRQEEKEDEVFVVQSNTYAVIKAIPIAKVVCRAMGWRNKGSKFTEKGEAKEKACFVADRGNFIVHGGTDHFPPTQDGYGPFEFIKTVKGFDNQQTFSWFKEQFSEVADVSKEEEERRKKEKRTHVMNDLSNVDYSDLPPMTAGELIDVLSVTIKHDNENKLICFLCMLSAYTENASFNIIFNAPSSTGKSYIPIEIAKLFPSEDVLEVAYVSPAAFFHDHGALDEETNTYHIDLGRKIIVFLDQPHAELLARLRSLLSHDKKEMRAHITDKQQSSSGNRTKHIVMRGFPAVVFCSANTRIDEQEATRFFLLSPEASQDKIRDAIYARGQREGDAANHMDWINAHPQRRALQDRIRAIRNANILDVIVPDPKAISDRFVSTKPILKPKHQRDIGRVMSLIKAMALLNFAHRDFHDGKITASAEDIEEAMRIWELLTPTQEYNISPYIYGIYKQVIVAAYRELPKGEMGVTRRAILSKHNTVFNRPLSDAKLRQEVLPMLDTAGLIYEVSSPRDGRVMLIVPSEFSERKPDDGNSEEGGGASA